MNMLIPSAYCSIGAQPPTAAAQFTLLIAIETTPRSQPALAARLGEYLANLRQMFRTAPGYLCAQLQVNEDGHCLHGYVQWQRREDWENAWDCSKAQGELFADSLLRLGARSIRFDSFLVAPATA